MSKIKPSIPKGMRDFGPNEVFKRQFIINHIKQTFEKFGFLPLETPTMENLSVLTGKYGDEGDQLLFKVLNSGDFLSKTTQEDIDAGSKKLTQKISEKGLRYDLTIPFARYVAMNQNDIAFPFKRYQIQPVWRADRPQKGRYREFYQCDADVIGTYSLLPEAEIIMMIQEVFGKLGIEDYTIKINNRKVLQGIIEKCNADDKFLDIVIAIDKLDKIGADGVQKELESKGLNTKQISTLFSYLNLEDNPAFNDINKRLNFYQKALDDNEIGSRGIHELLEVHKYLISTNTDRTRIKFDATLARGLNYYTGCIFEVSVNNVSIGSVSGGGRYDDLTSSFGLPNVSGVGFSFGLDRIYDVMTELNLFPKDIATSTQVLIIPFDDEAFNYALSVLQKLRNAQIKSELYPDVVKMKKSMKYANDKNIPFVILIGSNEIETNNLSFKNMETGEQQNLTIEQIIEKLS